MAEPAIFSAVFTAEVAGRQIQISRGNAADADQRNGIGRFTARSGGFRKVPELNSISSTVERKRNREKYC